MKGIIQVTLHLGTNIDNWAASHSTRLVPGEEPERVQFRKEKSFIYAGIRTTNIQGSSP
jgi:hypothetical protein